MTCPHCGARNTTTAPWCTQCLQPLGQDPSPPPAPPAPAQEGPPTTTPPRPAAPHATGDDHPGGAFRSVDGQVEWRCTACDTWNGLDVPTCSACGSRLAASVTGTRAHDVTGRVSRARQVLWVMAAIGVTVAVVSAVLLVLALREGVAS